MNRRQPQDGCSGENIFTARPSHQQVTRHQNELAESRRRRVTSCFYLVGETGFETCDIYVPNEVRAHLSPVKF